MEPRISAQDVMKCNMCETADAKIRCDSCLVNLCTTCVGTHTISDESKKHVFVKFQSRKSSLYPGCILHGYKQCETYCNQCDIPVCNTCVASDQHIGHDLLKILQVLDDKKRKIIEEQTKLKETIYPTYQDIASDVQNRMSQLEKEHEDLSTDITSHGEVWHREIDKLLKKLKAEDDEIKNAQLRVLQKHLDEINKKVSDIKDEIDSNDMTINSKDISKVFSAKVNVDRYTKLPRKLVPSLPEFIPGRIDEEEELRKIFGALSPSSLISEEHGYSMKTTQKSLEVGSSTPVKQLLDEPETVTTIRTRQIYLSGVVCLNDEEIWTKENGSIMRLYSINQGSELKAFRTKSDRMPGGIAVTKNGDLVYTDYDGRSVNIVKNEEIEEVIKLQKWKPRNVCSTFSSDLLVIMDSDDFRKSKVVRYSGSTEKQTIQFDDIGKSLFSSGFLYRHMITENRNLDICVSDNGAKSVVVVNQAGKLKFRYKGHTPAPKNKPFSPRGITTDSLCHILTADPFNDCVHIIDQDGQFLCFIDCELSEPWGLCTDTNDNLFVAQRSMFDSRVKKIKYLQ
ncbi:uncharacterized protein LOC133178254 [Saccostrea echinata]|uniref:uncharacterized protein LOC133178254 n=1 Tax=Saccostrea echinata TaxID=191078 RepID=UPI002A831FAB|nr:uncharacterized protein LOC133178254 [Saccostrea echinata]